MPRPIRTPTTPSRPTGPSGVTGPAHPTPAAPPAPFPANLDAFDARGASGARLSQPVTLGDFEGQAVSINAQGRLVLPNDGGKLSDTLNAHRAVLKGAGGQNPFAGLTDKVALRAVVERLAVLHRAGTAPADGDKQALDQRQLRATSIALMELATIRAGELGDPALQKTMLTALTKAVAAEPYRALKDFAWESLVARADEKTLPVLNEAKEAVYPSKPPSDRMLKDGKLTIAYYIDNDGSELNFQLSYMRSLGFTQKKLDDQNYLFTRPARGGQPAIEVQFKSPKTHDDKPHLFEKIDDPNVDIIAYTGHAGYGHRVDSAINQGASGTGDGKLVVLMQCWGSGNLESLERAFPDAHVVSTTEPSTDNHDQMMFKELLDGVLQKKGYEEIGGKVVNTLKNAWYLGDANAEEHFFFPTTRKVVGDKIDRDRDGVRDLTDHVFNVIYPKRLDAAGGYDPVAQAIADDALDGSNASKAVNTLSLVMRYSPLLEGAQAAKVKWGPDLPQPAGFFTPRDGDLRAYDFALDAATGRLDVKLSTRFAHTDSGDLSKMLAYEAGLFLGREAGLDAKGQAALALTMLERAAHQEGSWKYARGLLDEPWAEDTLFAQRYGLAGLTVDDIAAATGHADDLTGKHVKDVAKLVDARPELLAAVTRAPTRVGEDLPLPGTLRLASGDLDNAALQRVVTALGIAGKVESYGPTYLSTGEPNNLAVVVRDDAGQTHQLGLSLDNDGVVRAASRVDLQVDGVKARAGRAYLAEVAKSLGRDVKPLHDGYQAALDAGQAPAEAVATVLAGARASVAMGTAMPELAAFDKLRSYGLTTHGENAAILETFARLYPSGDALSAEQAVAAWLKGAGGARADALTRTYLEALAASGSRDGAGRALVEVFGQLPRPLLTGFPLAGVVTSGLVSPAALATTLGAFQESAGLSKTAMAKELMLAWAPRWSSNADAMKAALDEAVARDAPAAEVFSKALEALKPDKWNVPAIDTAVLDQLGLLSAGEATALAGQLERLRAHG